MKKRASGSAVVPEDDLLPEYEFDYGQSKPNRFARQFKGMRVAVVLEPDVAEVFATSESVNTLLRSIIKALPEQAQRPPPRRKGGRSNPRMQRTGSAGR